MSTPDNKAWRIAEVFGPTIQGEGHLVGRPCYFIRFGGCDYRCTWCDSPHAVLPELVARLDRMTVEDIVRELQLLDKGPEWIVFSGGNPALLDLEPLVARLHGLGYKIMIETQGTMGHDWLRAVELVTVSPKPPSAGNTTSFKTLAAFLNKHVLYPVENPLEPNYSSHGPGNTYFKVVVFDDKDYEYAVGIHEALPRYPMWLSIGNDSPNLQTVGNPGGDPEAPFALGDILDRMRWVYERTMNDERMKDVQVSPQMHTLAWGNVKGV